MGGGAGAAGDSEIALLHGFCDRCCDAGLPLSRGVAIIDTLHPVYEGRAFFWAGDKAVESPVSEYGPSTAADAHGQWQRSPFFYLLNSSDNELRRRLETSEPTGFDIIDELRDEGQTDYMAMVQRFGAEGSHRRDGLLPVALATMRPGGFSETGGRVLRRLVPLLALGDQVASLARDRGNTGRNLSRPGRWPPRAGRAHVTRRRRKDPCRAVVFGYARLHGPIRGHGPSDQLIPLLNDYAEAVISAVHGAGGDVLKLIGDGVLAIFAADDPARRLPVRAAGGGALRRALPR